MKKIIMGLAIITFFFGFNLARASVIINEFVSNPNDGEKEWVELLNTTGGPIDLMGWTIQDLTFSGTTITGIHDNIIGSVTIPGNGIVVIDVTGLNNGGDSITLYDNSTTPIAINNIIYGTVSGKTTTTGLKNLSDSGKSGALISGVWETNQNPTKGTENPSLTLTPVGTGALVNTNSDNNSSITTTTETKTKVVEIPKIRTKISAKNISFVGLPIILDANATGYSGEQLYYGKYFWNFGDGDSKEIKTSDSQKFTHTYFYPGEYNVSLEYFLNYYGDIPDASDKMIIKVIPADILISGVGDEKDFFIELSNNTNYETDISNWVLASDTKSFTIPRNTIIGSKKKIIISSKVTNFSIEDKNTLKLMTPEREVAFNYASFLVPVVRQFARQSAGGDPATVMTKLNLEKNTTNLAIAENLANDLQASAVQSEYANNNNNLYLPMFISIIFIGASASAVYFIRRKKAVSSVGNDFKILDE